MQYLCQKQVRGILICSKTAANVEIMNIGKKLQKMAAKLKELVDNKVVEVVKITQDKVEKTNSSVLDAKTKNVVEQCSH